MTVGVMVFLLGVVIAFMGIKLDLGFMSLFGGLIIGIALCAISEEKHLKPTAMDVYRNNTTLEITYKDGVAIDSVVVFKNKEEQQ